MTHKITAVEKNKNAPNSIELNNNIDQQIQYPNSIELDNKKFILIGNYYAHSLKDKVDMCSDDAYRRKLDKDINKKRSYKDTIIQMRFDYIYFHKKNYTELCQLKLAKPVALIKDEREVSRFRLSQCEFTNIDGTYSHGHDASCTHNTAHLNNQIEHRTKKFDLCSIVITSKAKISTISLEDFKEIKDCCHDMIEILEFKSTPSNTSQAAFQANSMSSNTQFTYPLQDEAQTEFNSNKVNDNQILPNSTGPFWPKVNHDQETPSNIETQAWVNSVLETLSANNEYNDTLATSLTGFSSPEELHASKELEIQERIKLIDSTVRFLSELKQRDGNSSNLFNMFSQSTNFTNPHEKSQTNNTSRKKQKR